jgi:hypothetical protein
MTRLGRIIDRGARNHRALALATAAVLAFALQTVAPTSANAQVTVTSHFVWTPTSSEISGDSAYMNNGATDDQPHALLFVQENATPGGVCGCTDLEEAIGVWYDASLKEWAVFNENRSDFPGNTPFNVLVVPKASKGVFTLRATAGNTSGDRTFINSALTNDKPHAIIQVTQVWNPGGASFGIYNPDTVGVRYYGSVKKWGIFNEDKTHMPLDASFNVLVGQSPSNGGTTSVLVATKKNIDGESVRISNRQINGDPNNVTFVTPDYNPGGKGGSYNDAGAGNDISVWYTSPHETVLNDTDAPPVGTAFNLLIFSS